MNEKGKSLMVPYKSSAAALILSLVLGPVGTLYAGWKTSLVLTIILTIIMFSGINIAIAAPTALFLWIVSIYLSVILVGRYNKALFKSQQVAA